MEAGARCGGEETGPGPSQWWSWTYTAQCSLYTSICKQLWTRCAPSGVRHASPRCQRQKCVKITYFHRYYRLQDLSCHVSLKPCWSSAWDTAANIWLCLTTYTSKQKDPWVGISLGKSFSQCLTYFEKHKSSQKKTFIQFEKIPELACVSSSIPRSLTIGIAKENLSHYNFKRY